MQKKQFYNIDYTEISKNLEYISHKLSVAKTHLDKGDINEALIIAESVEIKLIELEYNMYESRAVENRASWYRSNEKSDEQVRATLEKVVECNINALYIETWYNGTVIGYSDNPLIKHNIRAHGDFDVLESFCRIAKEYGVEIHIWVENFFIGGPNDWLAQELKEYLCIDRYGRDTYPTESYGDFAFLNPYDRYCRDLVLGVYREIVENYDIDGIHLDYIRFSEPRNDAENSDFGYNNNVIAGFQEAYNTTVDPHNITSDDHSLWKDWCKFREDIINSFVKEVYDMVQETKPYLWISAATYPAFSSMPQKIFQNFQDWVENGWMDEIFSMSYGSDITYPVGNANSYEKVIGTKAFYSAGLSAFESTAADILIAQISGVRDVGGDGANLFSWGSFINHNLEYAKALKAGIFSRPAVQSYKLSLTVAAGLERLTEDLGGVYMYVKPENSKFYESFKSSIAPILSKAEKFDLKEASDAEKLGYCNNTISDLNGLKEQLISFSDKEVCDSLNLKIDHLINCLKQSISRLS